MTVASQAAHPIGPPAAALGGLWGRAGRRHRGLQGRRLTPIAGGFCEARRAVSTAQRVFRIGHPQFNTPPDGAADTERAAVICPVRARGHLRAHPGQESPPPSARVSGSAAWHRSCYDTKDRRSRSMTEAETVRTHLPAATQARQPHICSWADLRRAGHRHQVAHPSRRGDRRRHPFTRGPLAHLLRNCFYIRRRAV